MNKSKIYNSEQIIQVIFRPKEDDNITEVDVYTYNVVNGEMYLRHEFRGYGGKGRTCYRKQKRGRL